MGSAPCCQSKVAATAEVTGVPETGSESVGVHQEKTARISIDKSIKVLEKPLEEAVLGVKEPKASSEDPLPLHAESSQEAPEEPENEPPPFQGPIATTEAPDSTSKQPSKTTATPSTISSNTKKRGKLTVEFEDDKGHTRSVVFLYRPIGINFSNSETPAVVAVVLPDSHAAELGVKADWVAKVVAGRNLEKIAELQKHETLTAFFAKQEAMLSDEIPEKATVTRKSALSPKDGTKKEPRRSVFRRKGSLVSLHEFNAFRRSSQSEGDKG